MLPRLFTAIASVISVYTVICFIAVIVTWIPGLKFTKFGKFMAAITDPYFYIFSQIKWLKFNNLDFSPILSIGILSLLSSAFSNLANDLAMRMPARKAALHVLINTVIQGPLQIISSLLGFLFLLLLIRWIFLLINHGTTSYNSAWNNFDDMIGRLAYKIARIFTKNYYSYQTCLLISWIVVFVVMILIDGAIYGIGYLNNTYFRPNFGVIF